MSAGSNSLVPGLPLTREQALALPGMRRYRLVEFLIRWEHFGAARDLLESLVDQKSGKFFYQYRLAQCYLATGDVERAKEVARALYAAPAARAIGTLAIGDVFYVEGRLARAEEYYRQALEVEKTRESAQRRLAWCLLHRRNLDGAAALAEQLAAGKRPAQMPPAAVRLLAAVATAGGRADQAGALRRDLKQRWHNELERLRAALELAAAAIEPAPASAEAPGPVPGDEAGGRLSVFGVRSSGRTDQPDRSDRSDRSDRTEHRTPNTDHRPFEPPTSGYVYPTARERRTAAQAAARQQARHAQAGPTSPAGPPAPGRPQAPASSPHPSSTPPAPQPLAAAENPSPPLGGDALRPDAVSSEWTSTETATKTSGISEPLALPSTQDASSALIAPPIQIPNAGYPPKGGVAPEVQNSGALRVALKELFGYDQFRPGQEEVVRQIMDRRSVLATMPTGSGKSLCFQLPSMLLPRATVVISPLIALMQDQIEGLPPRVRARATFLNSSLESIEQEQRLRQVAAGACSLIYAAPERLRQRPFLHALRRAGVSLLVVDEAHCISLWGQDFRPDYLFLPKLLAELDHPPLLAMTATATLAMQRDIRGQFRIPMETHSQGVFRPNLFLEVRRCENRQTKLKLLRELCQRETGSIIVYASTRARTEHLSQALNEAGVQAGFYHAGLPAEVREATQQRFMRDELRCLVATVAFGMGVDKPDIRLIVHHDLPRSLEGYYQEAGRAGRDGRPARCVLFASPGDRSNLSRWARQDRLAPVEVLNVHAALPGAARALTLAPDDLERETGLDETRVRVAISILERAGALRRHFDLPRACTLQVMAPGDATFASFVAAARLRPRQRVTRDTEELCALAAIAPDALEPYLLDWSERGWLEYRGSARGLRLDPLPAPDLEARVRAMLQTIEVIDEQRLQQLNAYVRARACRHQFLSDYFGAPHPPPRASFLSRLGSPCGGACDNCRAAAPVAGR